jgi:FAD/FMN-containing dehydrogenase
MTSEPLDSLLARPFEGRVVPHRDDPLNKYSDFHGDPTVLYPWSDAALCHAIEIKEHLGRNGFLRSGLSSSGDGLLQGEGGLVVDFSCFTRIEVRTTDHDGDGRIAVEVEAGANTRQLAAALIQYNAFLPLGGNPVRSVVSSVLSGRPGHFDRSMGRLSDYVENLQVITPRGDVASFNKGDTEFLSVLDSTFGGAIKAITFSAVAGSSNAVEMMSARFLYARAEFEAAIRLLGHPGITSGMDFSVHAHHARLGVVAVSVNIAGKPADHDRMAAVLDDLKSYGAGSATEATDARVDRVAVSSPAEIVELTVGDGLSGSHYVDRSLAAKHFEKLIAREDFDSFRGPFVRSIMVALTEPPGGTPPRVAGSLRFSLDDRQNIVVSADVFLPSDPQDAEIRFDGTAMQLMGPPVISRPRVAAQKMDRRDLPNVELSGLRALRPAAEIPGFGGQIYAPGDPDYDHKRTQYASSSYPEEQGPNGSMHPCMVAYPRSGTDDIGAAIRYAAQNSKNIQARSGGHQYCGLSSGPMDTILLSMDLYHEIEVSEKDGKRYATVGAGALLTDIAATFHSEGVTIPHGECPRVAIGGHVQSGGYGHLLRSYGLALDHVYQFNIYRADGTSVTVSRPPARDENSLFWGVLGGGPGSFGVLTDITFECIADVDHPYSWGYKSAYIYHKELFRKAMHEIRRWTELVADKHPGMPPDVDMCMTVVSRDWWVIDGIYLLEMVNGNKDGKDDGGVNNNFLKTAINNIASDYYALPCAGYYEGPETLSYMANSFVRRSGTTADGREFPQPYKKRLNCTKQPLSTTFVESFVNLVDAVVNSDNVLLVFQMFIGGGAYAAPVPDPPLSSICHRDVVLGIVFDCFYKPEGEQEAEQFQQDMHNLLTDYSGTQEIRMLWGSFGDTNISDDTIRGYDYDDDTWEALQQLKKEVDTGNLFHTRFTVQLPQPARREGA